MCHEYTEEEVANVLETLADLFSWKRRHRLVESAAVLRLPGLQWRPPSGAGGLPADGSLDPARRPDSLEHRRA